jgi:hypothetical protein
MRGEVADHTLKKRPTISDQGVTICHRSR